MLSVVVVMKGEEKDSLYNIKRSRKLVLCYLKQSRMGKRDVKEYKDQKGIEVQYHTIHSVYTNRTANIIYIHTQYVGERDIQLYTTHTKKKELESVLLLPF